MVKADTQAESNIVGGQQTGGNILTDNSQVARQTSAQGGMVEEGVLSIGSDQCETSNRPLDVKSISHPHEEDSGVAWNATRTCKQNVSQPGEVLPLERSPTVKLGYKSPELVEEAAPLSDAYSIVQVRDAVEQLESDPEALSNFILQSGQALGSDTVHSETLHTSSSHSDSERWNASEQDTAHVAVNDVRTPSTSSRTL